MAGRGWVLRLVLAAVLAALAGCFGVSQNPSYFPYLLPTGDIIRTHAKPGLGYYRDFDPHACRLVVRPVESTNPVRTQQVFIATVYDDQGRPRRHRRVEWMLEGAGNIVEVDESGFYPGRGYKVDNRYAVSYTDYCEHRITRGNAEANDDFVIRPGQSWCVVSSAVEGDSHLTVYAPEIFNWDAHKVFATTHWVDAEWSVPVPASNRAGTDHVFTTHVFRHTDHQSIANYRVRYVILDGPPAFFLPNHLQEAVVSTDLSGNAHVTIAQPAPQTGVNRIGIEIIRPPDPCTTAGAGIIIGRAETTKEWVGPSVSLTKTGPPTVAVGQEAPYTITVANNGRVETQGLTVRETTPEGLQFVRSEPQAIVEGNQLIWTLGPLPPGGTHTVRAFFRALRPGPINNCATVASADGAKADTCVTTTVTTPQLSVAKTAPTTAVINVPITYQIAVTNPGTGPATNVLLSDSFDPGLEHESRANPIELPVGTLQPGETRAVPLTLTPRRLGRLVNRVTASADGNLRAQAEHAVTVQEAQITLTKTGPAARYVNRPAVFDLRVGNPADVPLNNVILRDQLPPELAFVSATEGGQAAAGGQVVWNLGLLRPRETRAVQLTTRCLQISPRAVNSAVATADPGLQVRAEAALEIRGLPAFRLEVVDTNDPVEVGGRTQYKIDVTNQGSLPGNQVGIVATVPPQMRILNANGPSQPRIEGQRITFPPVDGVQPQQTLHYSIDVEAVQPGDVRFHVELRAATLREPVIEEESTTIYAPSRGQPAAPPAGPTGPPGTVPTPPLGPSPSAPPRPLPPAPGGPPGSPER